MMKSLLHYSGRIRIKSISRYFVILALGSLLSGCASLNKAQCISANWFDLGVDNALSGKRSNYVAEHTQACAKHAITPDFEAYKKGWESGVIKFCTAQSGWRYAMNGRYYHDTCSEEAERDFLPAYRLGRKIRDKKDQLKALEADSRELYKSLLASTLTPQQQNSVMSERFSISFDKLQIESDILRLERQASEQGLY
jgi:hypothetical protein